MRTLCLAAIACCALVALAWSGEGETGEPSARPFRLPGGYRNLVAVDVDLDGLVDLVGVRDGRFEVWRHRRGEGLHTEAPAAVLSVPGSAVGWDIATLDAQRAVSVIALIDGGEVRSWTWSPERAGFGEAVVELSGLRGVLPRGFHRLRLVRRVDGDERGDLVIPTTGAFELWLRGEDRSWRRGPSVSADVSVSAALDEAEDLAGRAGQSVSMPLFALRDVDGDGRVDIVSETADRYAVYRAGDDGRLPEQPTLTIDLASERELLATDDPDRIDFSNLTSLVSRTVQILAEDLDGDGAEEILLRSAGKVRLWRGGARMDPAQPDQVLKASGNVVWAVLFDENGDGLEDLWLIRVEAVSIGDIFLWLVASGSVDVDVFVYRFEGGRFARRPDRRLKVTVGFPSIPTLVSQGREIGEEISDRRSRPIVVADLQGAGRATDAVVLADGRAAVYLGKVGDGAAPDGVLELIDYSADKDEYRVDLDGLGDLVTFEGDEVLRALEGLRADVDLAIEDLGSRPSLHVLDLDGDGGDDVLVIGEPKGSGVSGALIYGRRASR